MAEQFLNLADVDACNSRCGAKLCRKVCTVTGLWIRAEVAARLTAFCKTDVLT
jgi:hypothetical protein